MRSARLLIFLNTMENILWSNNLSCKFITKLYWCADVCWLDSLFKVRNDQWNILIKNTLAEWVVWRGECFAKVFSKADNLRVDCFIFKKDFDVIDKFLAHVTSDIMVINTWGWYCHLAWGWKSFVDSLYICFCFITKSHIQAIISWFNTFINLLDDIWKILINEHSAKGGVWCWECATKLLEKRNDFLFNNFAFKDWFNIANHACAPCVGKSIIIGAYVLDLSWETNNLLCFSRWATKSDIEADFKIFDIFVDPFNDAWNPGFNKSLAKCAKWRRESVAKLFNEGSNLRFSSLTNKKFFSIDNNNLTRFHTGQISLEKYSRRTRSSSA